MSFDPATANAAAAAAANAGALGDGGVMPPVGGVPGLGLGFGKSLNFGFDAGLGGGYPFLGGLGGVPYVPVTPLGALWGFKGDLLVPIIIIGVAIFLLVVILLAIKAALAWKIDFLSGLKGGKGGIFRRAVEDDMQNHGAPHAEENQLNELAHMVLSAIQSQSCAQKVVCEIGTYARERDGLSSLLRILESMVPSSMSDPLKILRTSAEGNFDCADKYPCGNDAKDSNSTTSSATNHKVLTEPLKKQSQQQPSANTIQG